MRQTVPTAVRVTAPDPAPAAADAGPFIVLPQASSGSGAAVTSIAGLNAAIAAADAVTAPGTVTIQLGAGIALNGTATTAIDLAAGVTLDIEGNGHTLDGGGTQQGLFVYAGAVTVENLAIDNMLAQGGNGGGGGGGLGGGLFVGGAVAGDAGRVVLTNVSFAGDAARGGNGGGPGGAAGFDVNRSTPSGISIGDGGGAYFVPRGLPAFGPASVPDGGVVGYWQHYPAGFGGGTGGGYPSYGSGGGGLAAGGDIFVQAGGSITIAGTAGLGLGTLTAGTGAPPLTRYPGGQPGQAFGNGIYFQGNNTLTFALTGTETVAGAIGDDQGSAAAANYAGTAGYSEGKIAVAAGGHGTLLFQAANTYAGGTEIGPGATLDVAAGASAGSGAITLDAPSSGLRFDVTTPAQLKAAVAAADHVHGTGTVTIALGANIPIPGATLDTGVLPAGVTVNLVNGGYALIPGHYTVTTVAGLNAAIAALNAYPGTGPVTIELGANIGLHGTALNTLNIPAGVTLDLQGDFHTLNGGNGRGLWVAGGVVTLENVFIANMLAVGGPGAPGLGGGLYVGGGSVTLQDVAFGGDGAKGGNGAGGSGGFGYAGSFGGGVSGGLAAGGDVFVGSGASLAIAGPISLGAGKLTPGSGAQAFGNGIYFQGNNTLTLTPAGKMTIAGVIGDDKGSAAVAGYPGVSGYTPGRTSVVVAGKGNVLLQAANTYAGGTAVMAGATLEVGAGAAAGTGGVTLEATSSAAIFDAATAAQLKSAAAAAEAVHYFSGAKNPPGTVTLSIAASLAGGGATLDASMLVKPQVVLALASPAGGGVASLTLTASTIAGLTQAVRAADSLLAAGPATVTISLAANISLPGPTLDTGTLPPGVTLDIVNNGFSLTPATVPVHAANMLSLAAMGFLPAAAGPLVSGGLPGGGAWLGAQPLSDHGQSPSLTMLGSLG